MRFFRPEIEATLKTLGVLTLIGLVVWPFAWDYEQRRQARTWQSIACAYRMREAAVRAPVIAGVDYGRNPCQTLQRLGLTLEPPR
ncbi:MAG TPA: hypothetical protein VGV13_15045 [Methylomirabilota bacterium]|jgi:hypothetical protein|nr:hypothetical protein [Methylomirabilota bacterium]